MKKLFKHPIAILFLVLIFVVPTLTIFNLSDEVSNIENRKLASMPKYSHSTLLSGQYFNLLEKYISDHIYLRDEWIKSYTLLNMKLLGKRRINEIVVGAEGTLLPYYTDELSHRLESQLDNIPKMVDQMKRIDRLTKSYGGSFLFVGVPGQSSFLRDKYPFYIENKSDYLDKNENLFFNELQNQNINYLNMNEIFTNDYRDDYYLNTDHHCSFEGFFRTYEETIKSLSIEPLARNAFDITEIQKPILGSRNRQIYFLKDTDDRFKIACPKESLNYTKYNKGIEDNRLYYLGEERPNYTMYMGGDNAETMIDTARDELPDLLIFGDSFTNAIEPLVFLHFNKTRILDLRHYNEMSLEEYINLHSPDFVIMVRDDLNYGNLEGNGEF